MPFKIPSKHVVPVTLVPAKDVPMIFIIEQSSWIISKSYFKRNIQVRKVNNSGKYYKIVQTVSFISSTIAYYLSDVYYVEILEY